MIFVQAVEIIYSAKQRENVAKKVVVSVGRRRAKPRTNAAKFLVRQILGRHKMPGSASMHCISFAAKFLVLPHSLEPIAEENCALK
jgi:hypothetical protein